MEESKTKTEIQKNHRNLDITDAEFEDVENENEKNT